MHMYLHIQILYIQICEYPSDMYKNEYANDEIFHYDYAFIGCNLGCWNNECKGSMKKRNTNKSSITVRNVTSRSIEGLRRNGFVVVPIFHCNVCCKTKVATDSEALAIMGVPLFILERCDFIFFHKSTWTRELMEFVNSLMIGKTYLMNFSI